VTQDYVAAYRTFAGNGAGRAPAWLRELRERSIARFCELGFPTTKHEEWRFTNVAPIAGTAFRLAGPSATRLPPSAVAPFVLGGPEQHCLVFVNGRYSAELSRGGTWPAGVRVGSLGEALAADPGLIERHLGHQAAHGAFAALNTAFVADGAYVHVPAGVQLAAPVQLLFLALPGGDPLVMHPRTLVVVERGARVAVVETYAAAADGVYWTNAVTELAVEDGARVDWHRVQRESERAYHTATSHSRQGRDSVVHLHTVALGGALARHDVHTVLAGPGGAAILNGLYLPRGEQHVDHHTWIDHAAPHCETHEYFNGVLDGRARSVFSGRIIVRPGAQRTDSKQTNNNLLLSADAHADSQPQLEIYADDVKCTHGSTTGPLDEKALFYLRSRGVGADAARRLLTYGFAAEILDRMEVQPLRERLDALVRERAGV
jgi:Fe-S cluster assembly protein SufD